MRYHHVDVFSAGPYSGNSLTVFPDAEGLRHDQLERITRELRHFESIFLTADGPAGASGPPGADGVSRRARVFDLVGELDFAGHPVLGAACVLHHLHDDNLHDDKRPEDDDDERAWTLRLPARVVRVRTRRRSPVRYSGVLEAGPPAFLGRPVVPDLARWFSLRPQDLDPLLPPEVVSTGLRYLLVPVRGDALSRARIAAPLDDALAGLGAQFAYLLDATGADAPEGRHWSNDGLVEDVATGSAAGCVAAFLREHGRIGDGEPAVLRQGRFTGRPSTMAVTARGHGARVDRVEVGGDVAIVGEGHLVQLPD